MCQVRPKYIIMHQREADCIAVSRGQPKLSYGEVNLQDEPSFDHTTSTTIKLLPDYEAQYRHFNIFRADPKCEFENELIPALPLSSEVFSQATLKAESIEIHFKELSGS